MIRSTDELFGNKKSMRPAALALLLILVALLLSGTLKIGLLTNTYLQFDLPVSGLDHFQNALFTLIPYDASRGEEGVTAQGAILIGLLLLIGLTSWRGFESIHEGFNSWTWIALGLTGLTLLTAALGMQPHADGLTILVTGKFFGVLLALVVIDHIDPAGP